MQPFLHIFVQLDGISFAQLSIVYMGISYIASQSLECVVTSQISPLN